MPHARATWTDLARASAALALSAWMVACGAAGAAPSPNDFGRSADGPASPPTASAAPTHPAPDDRLDGVATHEARELGPRGGSAPEETAALMARAVLAADGEGYLRLVASGDAAFTTEQRNWARDLARQRPVELAIALQRVRVEGATATAALTMTWRMPRAKKPRTVAWPARFVRAEGDGGWLYAGEEWAAVRNGDVVVRHLRGFEATAKVVAALLPAIRQRVHPALGIAPASALAGRVQEVKLYPTMAHLQASIYPSYSAPLSGWNEPGESIKLLASRRPDAEDLAAVLAHEYAHVATFELGPSANDMPWWILEGVAEAVSAEARGPAPAPRTKLEGRLRVRARAGGLVDWAKLVDFFGEAQAHADAVYEQGHSMLAFITAHHGRAGRRAWLEKMATGQSLSAATREALGTSFEELDRAWRASLAAP